MKKMTEAQLTKKLTAALPTGWAVRSISLDRGSFILDCPRTDYYRMTQEEFAKLLTDIGKVVDSQPVTTGCFSADGGTEINTVFRIGSLNDPERIAG